MALSDHSCPRCYSRNTGVLNWTNWACWSCGYRWDPAKQAIEDLNELDRRYREKHPDGAPVKRYPSQRYSLCVPQPGGVFGRELAIAGQTLEWDREHPW